MDDVLHQIFAHAVDQWNQFQVIQQNSSLNAEVKFLWFQIESITIFF